MNWIWEIKKTGEGAECFPDAGNGWDPYSTTIRKDSLNRDIATIWWRRKVAVDDDGAYIGSIQ